MKFDAVKIGEYLYIKGRIGWKGLKKEEYLEHSDYRIINGKSLTDSGINWADCGFITKERYEESPDIMLQENDIVITKDGTIGKVDIIKDLETPTTVASGLFVLRNIKPDIFNTMYIYYFLKSPYFRGFIESRKEGSVIPHLYQKDFVELEIPLVDLKTQNRIVEILESIDMKIDINKKILNSIEAISNLIFKRWFIEFEFPIEDGRLYKSSGCKMVESELGEIPEGWRVQKLGDIYTNHDSKRKPLSKMERSKREKIYPYYGAISLVDYVDDYKYDGKFILLSEDGANVLTPDGAPNLQYVWGKFWVNNHAHVMTGKNYISTEFLYYMLRQLNFTSIVTGAVQPKISQSNLNSFKVIVPEDELIKKYDGVIQPLTEQLIELTDQINSLESLRDSLLPKLLSGEIEIPDESVVV